MTMSVNEEIWGLPDPEAEPGFYEGVATKRFVAWIVDVLVASALTALVLPFTFFLGVLVLPLLYMVVSFLYRWTTLARGSATWGMRLLSVEIRQGNGAPLDPVSALLHTTGYTISVVTFPLQLVSIALMLVSSKAQGLSDHVLGTAALNVAARH